MDELEAPPSAGRAPDAERPQSSYQRGFFGGGLVFLAVAAAAPLTVASGILPVTLAIGDGPGNPIAASVVVLLLFGVGYGAMSRYVIFVGAFHAYVTKDAGMPPRVNAMWHTRGAPVLGTVGLIAVTVLVVSNFTTLISGSGTLETVLLLILLAALAAGVAAALAHRSEQLPVGRNGRFRVKALGAEHEELATHFTGASRTPVQKRLGWELWDTTPRACRFKDALVALVGRMTGQTVRGAHAGDIHPIDSRGPEMGSGKESSPTGQAGASPAGTLLSEERSAEVVAASLAGAPDPRLSRCSLC